MPATSTYRERRTYVRVTLPVHDSDNWCTLRTGQGESATARIMDINMGGCRLALPNGRDGSDGGNNCRCTFQTGDHLEFQDCGLQRWSKGICGMQAQVVWVEGQEMGCRFDTPLESRHFSQNPAA